MNNEFTEKKGIMYFILYLLINSFLLLFFVYQFHDLSFNHMMHSPQPTVKHVNF